MKCPFCGYEESKVVDSRPTDEGARIRRRRECLKCQKRFTTYEVIETVPIIVVKKDKSRETFDREKLLRGILRACEKRPVSAAANSAAGLPVSGGAAGDAAPALAPGAAAGRPPALVSDVFTNN